MKTYTLTAQFSLPDDTDPVEAINTWLKEIVEKEENPAGEFNSLVLTKHII